MCYCNCNCRSMFKHSLHHCTLKEPRTSECEKKNDLHLLTQRPLPLVRLGLRIGDEHRAPFAVILLLSAKGGKEKKYHREK